MPFVFKCLALVLSIPAALAADKEGAPFRPPAADQLPHHQTNDKVTIGAEPYAFGDKIKAAFGKLVPYNYGVLPVLIVIQNDSNETIRVNRMKAEYVGPLHERVTATPARDVRYLRGVDRPGVPRGPLTIKKKNPLDAWEIEGHAFTAQMLPAGNTASGFLYFQTGLERGATIYITGLTEAASGKELLFFELPLN